MYYHKQQRLHQVNRRIGGLEKKPLLSLQSILVNRRIGGLEMGLIQEIFGYQVNRRIGGLEIT